LKAEQDTTKNPPVVCVQTLGFRCTTNYKKSWVEGYRTML